MSDDYKTYCAECHRPIAEAGSDPHCAEHPRAGRYVALEPANRHTASDLEPQAAAKGGAA